MNVAIILGTRPEIIKMAPVIRACERQAVDFFVLHTGQHYSKELHEAIWNDLELAVPKYNLAVGSAPYRKQVSAMVCAIEKVVLAERPDVVIVQGDTMSVLAGAIAAKKSGIKVAHHEAGLRSDDLSMPEEVNRILTDNIADYRFVPTVAALNNLKEEGLEANSFVVGNTIVDAIYQNVVLAEKKTAVLARLGLEKGSYVLATLHRAENVDCKTKLQQILDGLALISGELQQRLILPLHPRTRARLREFQLTVPDGIEATAPLGFLDFLQLEKNATVVLTDSGGIQEECCIFEVPCVTLRENTERPETLACKANILAGTEPRRMLMATKKMLQQKIPAYREHNIFGAGNAGELIMATLSRLFTGSTTR